MQVSSTSRQCPTLPVFLSPHFLPVVTNSTSLPSQNSKNRRARRIPALSLVKSRVAHPDAPSSSPPPPSSFPPSFGNTDTGAKAAVNTVVASARQAAVAEVKGSSDWASALSRVEDESVDHIFTACSYASTIWREMSETVLQVQDLNIILRYFGEAKRWKDVSQLFDWMLKHDKTNVASYSSFIKYMGKSRNLIKALQAYDDIEDEAIRSNVSVCNSLLGCMLKNGKFESCIKLFNQIKDDGLVPDLVTYSTLLAGCIKVEHGYSKALQLVKELENRGLQMDSVIYGTLLAICASNNLCEEAEGFFHQMKAEGLSPNLFHYSSLLNAYSVDGNCKKAEILVKDMKSAGLVPNKVILTTLMKVYVRGGLFDKSRELLIELDHLGYAEDEIPYCLLMDNLAKNGRVREAKALFDEMKRKNIKSDGYSYSIMISAFCRSGQLNEAKELAREFEASYDKYDLVMINTLLRAYCNLGDMENVMLLLKKMDELTISPDWNTFQILIKYFFKEKLYHLAYQTVEDMHRKGYQLDEELCTSLLLHLAQSGAPSEAFSVYNMLRYSKGTLRRSIHEKMLNILVGAKLFKNAYVVMKDNAEEISVLSLENFGSHFMKSGNINMINDVIKALKHAGCKISQTQNDNTHPMSSWYGISDETDLDNGPTLGCRDGLHSVVPSVHPPQEQKLELEHEQKIQEEDAYMEMDQENHILGKIFKST
ncbi:hypothetical protein Taro_027537, partial [Colocasia esculenta]|nr:hypothetical protein [Colocasia esculenta]